MKVFICWSGERSRLLAEAMRQWLPSVIQAVEPFMSEFIEKGKSWPNDLDAKLHEANVGLICLTRENLEEPWLQFEAGALYMHLSQEHVCPYVLDLSPSEIPWPLARFQATKAVKEDTKKFLDTINKTLGESALDTLRLTQAFEMWWPKLEEKISAAQKSPILSAPVKREPGDILEELVSLVRSQSRQIESLEDVVRKLAVATQYGIQTLGATTPADIEHRVLTGKNPLPAAFFRFFDEWSRRNPPTDVTPGTPIPGTRSEST
jgi:hypothetical protein